MERLKTGQEITVGPWMMDDTTVSAYLEAVGCDAAIYQDAGAVPPMAVAGRALGALLKELAMPPGSIHIGQELELVNTVKPGQELTCGAKLVRESRRGTWRILVLDFSVAARKSVVLKGRTTVMVPVEERSS